ncbi:MAG: epoxyqueuosine reductase [Clostridia bacterium]|nr:epoxyqueuosine reductase [Clostridia bacterium]
MAVAVPMEEACRYLLPGQNVPKGSTVIVAAIPYYCGDSDGTVAKYARGRDYHRVLRMLFADAVATCGLSDSQIAAYSDVSPFREVALASAAGLGVIGENGLLLTESYGSYVFLGEICGDIPGPTTALTEPSRCSGCGACHRACPTGGNGCLSELTQRRGALSAEEEALMRHYQTAWGCDRCQDVCPANFHAKQTKLPAFCEELVPYFDHAMLSGLSNHAVERLYADRAFVWRGGAVVKRNAAILSSADGADDGRSCADGITRTTTDRTVERESKTPPTV